MPQQQVAIACMWAYQTSLAENAFQTGLLLYEDAWGEPEATATADRKSGDA